MKRVKKPSRAAREAAASKGDVAAAIRALFRPFGGVGLQIPARDAMREPPKFR